MKITLYFLLLFGIFSNLVECRELSTISSFSKDINAGEKIVIPSQPAITETEDLIYAICDKTDYHFSSEKYCNITVEILPFTNTSRIYTCFVRIAPDESNYQTLSRFTMLSFTANKIILFWMQEDNRFSSKSIIFKILKMSSCQLVNVTMPIDQLSYVVAYENKLDLILSSQKYCGSPSCKITLNGNGRQMNFRPLKILTNFDIAFQSSLGPVSRESLEQGFYAAITLKSEEKLETRHVHLFQIHANGRGTVFDKILTENYVSFSNSHEYFSLCEMAESIKISCRQYNVSLELKISIILEFQSEEMTRWVQPYNLEDGSLLIVSGATSHSESRHYNNFDVIKIDPDGRKDRPLVVEGLDLKCKRTEGLRVYVVENELDEICFYFLCRSGSEYQHKLSISVKCLPKTTFTMVKRRPAIIS